MIVTLGENQKGYIIKKYNPERETLFQVDGLTWEEAIDMMRE